MAGLSWKGRAAVPTRQCFELWEEAERGWVEVSSGGCRRLYGAVAVVEEIAHMLSAVESGEERERCLHDLIPY